MTKTVADAEYNAISLREQEIDALEECIFLAKASRLCPQLDIDALASPQDHKVPDILDKLAIAVRKTMDAEMFLADLRIKEELQKLVVLRHDADYVRR